MEIVELHNIDENELRGLLHDISTIWDKNSGVFDTGLRDFFRNIEELDNLIFGVNMYLHGDGMVFIVLTEYFKDSQIVTFRITAKNTSIWLEPFQHSKGEIQLRTILENLTREELEIIGAENQYRDSLVIFVCPYCGAQYAKRALQTADDGSIICQNCNRLCNPLEQEVAQEVTSEES